jgi:hypothetical protein
MFAISVSFSFVRGFPRERRNRPLRSRTLADRAGIPSVGVGLMFEEALGIDRGLTPLAAAVTA